MESAALYTFALAARAAVLCLAHVTNTMGQTGADFEKGELDGTSEALMMLEAIASQRRQRVTRRSELGALRSRVLAAIMRFNVTGCHPGGRAATIRDPECAVRALGPGSPRIRALAGMTRTNGGQAMADGSKVKNTDTQWTQATPAGYMPGFGNDFETEALPGALPAGQNSPQRTRLRALCRAAVGLALHRAARHQRALLALPHPPVACSTRRSSSRRRCPTGRRRRASASTTARSGSCAGTRCRSRTSTLTFLTGLRTMTTAGDVNTQAGMAAHVYLVTQSMERRLLLQRRRRAAGRAAAGRAALLHRVRHHRRRSPARSASSRAA